MSRVGGETDCSALSFPRSRGDEPPNQYDESYVRKFSPLTRG